MNVTAERLAGMIDHTQLHMEATEEDIEMLAAEAIGYGFGTVCVNPFWVQTASRLLRDTDVGVVSVVGFPLGQSSTDTKLAEANGAVADGATELDMVLNVGALKSQRFGYVEDEIRAIAALEVPLKVIIEACYLLPEEKIMACELSKRAGADYIKTSTGYGKYGATKEDVELIRHIVGGDMCIKAAGGISGWKKAQEMIDAGADRLGASKSVQIMEEFLSSQ